MPKILSIAPQRRHGSGAETLQPAHASGADQLVGRGRGAERERLGEAQRRRVPLTLARLPAQAASLAILVYTACSPGARTSLPMHRNRSFCSASAECTISLTRGLLQRMRGSRRCGTCSLRDCIHVRAKACEFG